MKKTSLSIAICIALAFTQVRANNNKHMVSPTEETTPVVHNILSNKLPTKLLTVIKKEYSNYWITSLYKETVNGKVSYHITVENPDQVVKLTAAAPSNWVIQNVTPKEQPAS